jgi:hypothetical protein
MACQNINHNIYYSTFFDLLYFIFFTFLDPAFLTATYGDGTTFSYSSFFGLRDLNLDSEFFFIFFKLPTF